MSCHGNNRKRRIAIIAGGGAVGVITYASLTANPVAAAALPVVLAFAACPAMCAAIGGAMWLRRRFSKGKNQAQIQQPDVNSKEEAAVEVKTESIDRNQQHLTYQQKRRKDKAAAQDTYAISD